MTTRRCVVPGCTSARDEEVFHETISRGGVAICPRHRRISSECSCAHYSNIFSYHGFPKSPGLRSVWRSLLKLAPDFQPKRTEAVCSRHFDIDEVGRRGSNKKVPILEIDRTEMEIREILADRVSSVISAARSSPPNDQVATRQLANVAVSTISAVEGDYEDEENNSVVGIASGEQTSSTFRSGKQHRPNPEVQPNAASYDADGVAGTSTTRENVDSLSQELLNTSLDDVEGNQIRSKSIRRFDEHRTPPAVGVGGKRFCKMKTPDFLPASRSRSVDKFN